VLASAGTESQKNTQFRSTGEPVTDEKQPEASFSLEKIYIKDFSFEAPNTPDIFLEQQQPQIDIKLDIEHNRMADSEMYEVVLPLSVTAKANDKTYFLAEVHQAGVFQIQGVPEDDIQIILEINCPNILLPYAREAIGSMIGRGGFPPVLINPINFEVLYHQRHAEKQEA
jgi:preprotein translocase subunit SecB